MNLSTYQGLIVALFIIMIIAINIWLFTSIKNNKTQSTFNILKKSAETLRDPFKQENKDIEELSVLVKKIKTEIKKEELL